MKEIVYTDLDGTILDHDTYSYSESRPGIDLLKKVNVPLIFCTSKTRFEIEHYRKKLQNTHPFISENGGGIFIPKNYFNFDFKYDTIIDRYKSIILGEKFDYLLKILDELKKEFRIRSFIDMNLEEIAKSSNLSLNEASLAKKREFEIPFKLIDKKDEKELLKKIKKLGLNCMAGGRYYHLAGENDKGKAVKILSQLFRQKHGKIHTFGFGDSYNDFSMLDNVDEPYLVKKKDDTYCSDKYNCASDIGPKGWNNVIQNSFKKDK